MATKIPKHEPAKEIHFLNLTVKNLKPLLLTTLIGHFTVMDGSEGEGDLVLIQTLSALLWKLFLKNTS